MHCKMNGSLLLFWGIGVFLPWTSEQCVRDEILKRCCRKDRVSSERLEVQETSLYLKEACFRQNQKLMNNPCKICLLTQKYDVGRCRWNNLRSVSLSIQRLSFDKSSTDKATKKGAFFDRATKRDHDAIC